MRVIPRFGWQRAAASTDAGAVLESGLKQLLEHLRDETDYEGLIKAFAARVRARREKLDAGFHLEP